MQSNSKLSGRYIDIMDGHEVHVINEYTGNHNLNLVLFEREDGIKMAVTKTMFLSRYESIAGVHQVRINLQ